MPSDRRKDTERNHTATHLLHSALRQVLGDAVHQAGSLVAPDRLRFDFTHHGPVTPEKLAEVEAIVNREIWRALPVTWTEMPYPEARAPGAMALFGEKYGDVVRVVDVPEVSMELCGGTHVRNTSEIGLFRVLSETGVASGRAAHRGTHRARRVRAPARAGADARPRRGDAADAGGQRGAARTAACRGAPRAGEEARGGAARRRRRVAEAALGRTPLGGNGAKLVLGHVTVDDAKALQAMGDALREQLTSGVGLLAARLEDGKGSLLVVVTDDLRTKGLRADAIVRDVAAVVGGRGGGKPHMAQAGIPDADRLDAALEEAPRIIAAMLAST